jgi:hypothetical protein
MFGRGAAVHDEFEGVFGVVQDVQLQSREVAGGVCERRCFRMSSTASSYRGKTSGCRSDEAHEGEEERESGEEARRCLDSTNLTTSGVGVCGFRRSNTQPGGVG